MNTIKKKKPADVHYNPADLSTTIMERAAKCCGTHQTIAGALLRSPEWKKWRKKAMNELLFDAWETEEIGDMSSKHFTAFVRFIKTLK